jgi:hypothetical protein
MKTLDNSLSELVKAGMLYKLTDPDTGKVLRGTFQLNPFIVGKGDWKDIVKLRLTIDFNADGKKMLLEEKRGQRTPQDQLEGQTSLLEGETE